MSCPLGVCTPVVLLALYGFGLVLVGISQWDSCPLWSILLLLPFALFGSILVLALLGPLLLLWFLFLLSQLLDLGLEGKDLLFFQRWGIPCVGLAEGFELVVHQEHEGIGFDFCPFLIFILFLGNVGDKLTIGYSLVCHK